MLCSRLGFGADQVAVATSGFGCDGAGRSPLYTNQAVYWGDLHSHTTYSDDALQRQGCHLTPAEALETAVGNLDFVSITDHAETNIPGFYTLEKWTNTLAQEMAFQTAHPEMVVFPAFEYTKTGFSSPALNWRIPDGNGHKNVILRDFEHVPPHAYGADVGTTVQTLLTFLDSTNSKGHYIVIPHHPAKGSEPAATNETADPLISMATDWSTNSLRQDVCALVEIYSRHGGSEIDEAEEPVHNFRAEASVGSALNRWLVNHNPVYKMGIIASTDTHSGRPGDVREEADNVQHWLGEYTGGLAAVWATNGSRGAIWRSLTGARTYGTSGAKIGVEFTAKLGGALVPMGGTLYHGAELADTNVALVHVHVRATGETTNHTIARIQLYRNSTCVMDESDGEWGSVAHVDFEDRLPYDYAYYRVKIWQNAVTLNATCQWERAWSSPIWIEKGVEEQAWEAGFEDIGGGWRRLGWFGDYAPMEQEGWIWHNQHGFFYAAAGSTPESVWFFANDMEWLYTGNALYPYLYRNNDGAWLWYNGSTNPRWFMNFKSGQWEWWP